MTCHAGHTFSGGRHGGVDGCETGKLQSRTHGRMTPPAEVPDGAASQGADGLFEFLKHGGDGSIGMTGSRPFFVDLFVAGAAGLGGGIGAGREDVRVRVDAGRDGGRGGSARAARAGAVVGSGESPTGWTQRGRGDRDSLRRRWERDGSGNGGGGKARAPIESGVDRGASGAGGVTEGRCGGL